MLKKIKLENGDVVVCSPDIVGHITGWIDSLYNASRGLDKFGVLSALILDTNKKIYFHGGFFTPRTCIPLSYAMGEEYFGQYPGTRQVDVFPLYCSIISKEVVEKIGISDSLGSDIFVDADFCIKVMLAGYKLYSTDKLAVVYQGGPKSHDDLKKFGGDFSKNAYDFQTKYGGLINSHYKYPILYTAKVTGPSGFAGVARNYIHGLVDVGINTYFEPLDTVLDAVEPTNDEKVNSVMEERGDMFMPQITWGQAPYFIKNSGVYKVGHCEFEAEEAPEVWIKYCNMMDEVWVPTEWDKKKFEKAGVNVPIHIIHQGVDPQYFHPDYAPMQVPTKETFKFICNAAWYPRKNLRNLIIAFQSEFKQNEDVCLIIKTINLGLNKGIQEEMADIPQIKGSANVYVREDEFKPYQLPSFYTMGDCFVLPTHGEGWGLPIFEALACGIPVITTGYGAPFEVLKDDQGKALPGVHFLDWRPSISTEPYVYIEGKTWAEPNLFQLKQEMRAVYTNRAAEKAAALKTSATVRQKFSWQKIAGDMKARIVDIYENKLAAAK